jgi:hypothetical protein
MILSLSKPPLSAPLIIHYLISPLMMYPVLEHSPSLNLDLLGFKASSGLWYKCNNYEIFIANATLAKKVLLIE